MKRGLVLLFVAMVSATYKIYEEEDICCLPSETGKCEALISRWYYNVKNWRCEKFSFGGCDGNANNFLTKCDCQKCCGDNKDICCQPRKVGPCKAAFRRWYYNSTNDACQEFTYGGCEGNQNNFKLRCQCEQRCLQK